MSRTKQIVPRLSKVVVLLLLSIIVLVYAGCSEDSDQVSREAIEAINNQSNGLVQSAEDKNQLVVVKYLTPLYRATVERKLYEDKGLPLDSLVSQFSHSMAFYVTVKSKETQSIIDQQFDYPEWQGVVDAGAMLDHFSLQSGDSLWLPVYAIPERKVSESDIAWLVVFAVDPTASFHEDENITLSYADPFEREGSKRFIYSVRNLLHS